ncbi:MAG: hypothetical protein ABMA64_09910 [Myxococcota bacterium]
MNAQPSPLARWFTAGSGASDHAASAPWYATLWLTGVDYFSSLGYAPGLAVLAAGYVAPLATVLLVLVTFLAALPVYSMVAKHSPHGEGSIKMIERLTVGWGRLGWIGKVLVLVLIGFAMTDFVITITLSAADATHHVLENPILEPLLPHRPVVITAALIGGLCLVFLAGFREAITVSIAIGVPYMVMSAAIVVAGIVDLSRKPELVAAWWHRVSYLDIEELRRSVEQMSSEGAGPLEAVNFGGPGALVLVALLVFPKLALGMSGFETGVSVMPHISAADVAARVRATRLLLASAATLMCLMLLGANFVATVRIPEQEFFSAAEGVDGGTANGRALAWLAHELLGHGFGTLYDFATVAILWFAGASAMAGLLNILPRYLPRFGMSPDWLGYRRPLVIAITVVCLLVNQAFRASVEAQGGAYATGVLVLMAAGAFAVLLAEPGMRWLYGIILLAFLYVLVVNVVERPDGIKIAGMFILATVVGSIWSRWNRASELRVKGVEFADHASAQLWGRLQQTEDLVLIPVRSPTPEARSACEARRIQHHQAVTSHFVFLHVRLVGDTSQFQTPIKIRVTPEGNDFVIEVEDAVAVANAIAFVAVELGVREVVIGLLDNGTPLVNAVMYLTFGTGEVGYAVRAIFMRLREQWLAEQQDVLRQFDTERDRIERETLRDMVVLETEERQRRLDSLFETERRRFLDEMPKLKRLPHLILFE